MRKRRIMNKRARMRKNKDDEMMIMPRVRIIVEIRY